MDTDAAAIEAEEAAADDDDDDEKDDERDERCGPLLRLFRSLCTSAEAKAIAAVALALPCTTPKRTSSFMASECMTCATPSRSQHRWHARALLSRARRSAASRSAARTARASAASFCSSALRASASATARGLALLLARGQRLRRGTRLARW